MAWGDASNPARFGTDIAGTSDRELFLKMFGGEVMAAFTENVIMRDKVTLKTITQGKSFQFPKTWKATSEFHTAGAEMLGNDIDTDEVVITIDGLVVAHTAIYDLDAKISHFDVTGEFSAELGRELARHFDKDVMRQIILAARSSGTAGWTGTGGKVVEDSALAISSGAYSGVDYIDAIREAVVAMEEKNVPESYEKYMVVRPAVFDAIRYAKDASNQYLVLNRDFSAQAGIQGRVPMLDIEGVKIMKSNLLPNTDERAASSVYSKYRAAYDTTTGIIFAKPAVATLVLQDIAMETERDVRRQEDFMVAKMAVGHGTLRPECAVELRSGAPTTT